MELITLCGLVIVIFGLWVEFELAVKTVVKIIRNCKFVKDGFTNKAVRHPVYMSRMPVCLADLSQH